MTDEIFTLEVKALLPGNQIIIGVCTDLMAGVPDVLRNGAVWIDAEPGLDTTDMVTTVVANQPSNASANQLTLGTVHLDTEGRPHLHVKQWVVPAARRVRVLRSGF